MRRSIGAVVLLAGVGALGLWAAFIRAPEIERHVTAQAQAIAAGSIHGLSAAVSGRDITLTGLMDTAEERAALLSAFEAVEGRRVVRDETALLPVAAPYTLSAIFDAEALALEGYAPTAVAREQMAGVFGAAGAQLEIASGAPEGWTATSTRAFRALEPLLRGALTLSDQTIRIEGVGATPAELAQVEAALAALPSDYDVTLDLEALDDGTPFRLRARFVRGEGGSAEGKLPATMGRGVFALEGAPALEASGVEIARIASADGLWRTAAMQALSALSTLETGSLNLEGQRGTLTGVATRLGREAAEEALAALPEGYAITPDIALLDDGRPLALRATKSESALILSGKMPFGTTAVALDLEALDPRLTIAEIEAQDAGLIVLARQGIRAANTLETAALMVADGMPAALSLTGTGTRAQIALAYDALQALPERFEITADLQPLDDGLPLGLSADKVGDVVTLLGKVPYLTEPAALGLTSFEEAVYASEVDARAPAFLVVAQAGLQALAALESGTMVMQDAEAPGGPARLRIEGEVTRAGLSRVNAALSDLPGGIAPIINVVFADDGTPIRLSVSADDGVITLNEGKLPYGTEASDLGVEVLGETVTVAEIAPRQRRFVRFAAGGIAALRALESGQLSIVDGAEAATISLQGVALTPAARDDAVSALGEAAEGAEIEITVLDSGAPISFEFGFDAVTGAELTGRLPVGLSPSAVADRLDLTSLTSDAAVALIGNAAGYEAALEALANWLPEVERLEAVFEEGGLARMLVTPAPGVDASQLSAGLKEATGVAPLMRTAPQPALGAERTRLTSGRAERFSGVAWLPIFDFQPSEARCDAETVDILAQDRVSFVTASARLDARALRAVNALAGVIVHCLQADPTLRVEVAGHTDSNGSSATNLTLSQERAEAVAAALMARGVPEAVLSATGYGEAEPRADNETEAGRAANRRTEIRWSSL